MIFECPLTISADIRPILDLISVVASPLYAYGSLLPVDCLYTRYDIIISVSISSFCHHDNIFHLISFRNHKVHDNIFRLLKIINSHTHKHCPRIHTHTGVSPALAVSLPLISTFNDLWLTILDYMDQFLHLKNCDLLVSALTPLSVVL